MHQCKEFDVNCKDCEDEACAIASVFDYEEAPPESQWSDEQKKMIKEILAHFKPVEKTCNKLPGLVVYSILPMPCGLDLDVHSILPFNVGEQNG